MIVAVDTETTGIDFYHGAQPFLVVTCDDRGESRVWEWEVDPLTRRVLAPDDEVDDLGEYLGPSQTGTCPLVFQNAKFDVTALGTIRPEFAEYWEWDRTHDTLLLAHLLESNRPKNLTALAVRWLATNIEPYETRLGNAVKQARRIAKSRYPDWATAKEGRPEMPSCGTDGWRFDYWLPRALFLAGDETARDEGWGTVLREYAEPDAVVTMRLYQCMLAEVKRRGLEAHYEQRRKCIRIAFDMERRGVTVSGPRLKELRDDYSAESITKGRVCLNIARTLKYDLVLPEGGVNQSLRTFYSDVLKAPPIYNPKAKTDAPTLNAAALAHYSETMPEKSLGLIFTRALLEKRKRDTGLSFMDAYERFGVRPETPVNGTARGLVNAIKANPLDEAANSALQDYVQEISLENPPEVYLLHPQLNMTGTDTLRWSSANPNEQNISKKDAVCRACYGDKDERKNCASCGGSGLAYRNLRHAFGPAHGRIWYSIDAQGIEDRLPAYKSGQQELIDIFERSSEAPYYGSNHLLRFHTVYPEIWDRELAEVGFEKVGPHCKKKYASTWYQWCKNGGFAVQYGAVDRPGGGGTADRAFHKNGAHALLKSRFAKLERLNRYQIDFANRNGYVETMPDRTLGCKRGYPLLCTRTDRGKVLETVPLSYYIQGTAMYWTMKAMLRVYDFFQGLNDSGEFAGKTWPGGYHIALQVHDELVIDCPAGPTPDYNDPVVSEVCRLMRLGGDDLGIPTPVGVERHELTWAEGVTLSL